MRWNQTVTLLSPVEKYQDSAGAWHEGKRSERTIFCNEFMVGLVAMAHLRNSDIRAANSTEPVDVGLRNEHMIQVHALDYQGEDQCIYRGEEYEVIYISGAGEYAMLTIGQKLGNSIADEGGEPEPTDPDGGDGNG